MKYGGESSLISATTRSITNQTRLDFVVNTYTGNAIVIISDSKMRTRVSIERVLEWLSSSPSEYTSIVPCDPSSSTSTSTVFLQNHSLPSTTVSVACKACNERNATCDGQRPRCSHCLHEQLMCFYIGPGQHGRRRQQRS